MTLLTASILVIAVMVAGALYQARSVPAGFWVNPACDPPCWNGIKPGDHVDKHEIAQKLSIYVAPGDVWENRLPEGVMIAWHWKRWPWQRSAANSIFLVGNEVRNITIAVPFKLTVEEILHRYGIPENVMIGEGGVPEHPYVRVDLNYPTKGFTFVATVIPWNTPNLQPTSPITEATFHLPADPRLSQQETEPGWHPQSWPGYGLLSVPVH